MALKTLMVSPLVSKDVRRLLVPAVPGLAGRGAISWVLWLILLRGNLPFLGGSSASKYETECQKEGPLGRR